MRIVAQALLEAVSKSTWVVAAFAKMRTSAEFWRIQLRLLVMGRILANAATDSGDEPRRSLSKKK